MRPTSSAPCLCKRKGRTVLLSRRLKLKIKQFNRVRFQRLAHLGRRCPEVLAAHAPITFGVSTRGIPYGRDKSFTVGWSSRLVSQRSARKSCAEPPQEP